MNSCSIAYEFLCAYCIILQTTTWSVPDQDVEYTNHDVVYIFHGDNLEIDEIVIIFVYSKKNVFYLKIRTIVLITIVDYPLDLRAGHKKRETVEYQPFPFF